MTKTPLPSRQILLPLLFSLLTTLPLLVISQPPSSEVQILLNLKQQWGLDQWGASAPHCGWPGIRCSGGGETVIAISLNSQNIDGDIPPSICGLANLTALDLGNNYLGGEFPTSLYNCTKLQSLNISSNLFVGELPSDINKLSSNLQHLDLSYNNFTGDIPSSIGQLKGLTSLYLHENLLNGTFPSELGNLINLEELFLMSNPFSPMILPPELGNLKSLRFLWMSQCNLTGEIPKSFGNLTSLEHLDLVGNGLEGEIPSGLFLLKNLKLLYLYKNSLSGELPPSIEASSLVEIDISTNRLTGKLPEAIASLPRLEYIGLFSNQFYGELPSSIGLMPSLTTLRIWSNNFSGPLPPELGLHSKLEELQVRDNGFSGPLPENLCSGKTLVGVIADNNRLNGSMPKSLAQCQSLLAITISNNGFSGEFPAGIWSLMKLSELDVSYNSLSGQLPEKLASNLTRVIINNNKFSGEIPENLEGWENLMVLEASSNLISGTVPLGLTTLTRLNSLSLDRNRLSGELPSQIVSWQSLNSLNLSHNHLSGSIPPSLGSLPVLNSLDLSDNEFSGEIPPELGRLKLPNLNLSSNNLIGGIPFGFDNGAYESSFLDTKLCSGNGVSHLPRCSMHRREAKGLSSKYLALILALALVALIATVYFTWSVLWELRRRKQGQDASTWKLTSFHRLEFTEDKILANLSEANLVGSGGSGKVYRVPINRSGDRVAVKRIWTNRKAMSNSSSEKEFLAEVQILGTIRHLNIVKLLCCVSSDDSKLLVYEYMENQSLDKWIHERERESRPASLRGGSVRHVGLDWPARLRVAVGAAQGLCYMHHDCSPPIIHRDVKSSNILLDSEFNAKIADFGLAKILARPGGQPHTVSAVAGSFGYLAPEYCYTTKVNEKIDIYSFGVVLLELVTGKEAHLGDEHSNLAEWAWRLYSEGRPIGVALDREVREPSHSEEMTNVFKLGLMCTSSLPSSRPSMKEVLQVLQRCSVLDGSGRAKPANERDVAPLLGSGGYISSCKNSRKAVEEDDYSMV